MKLNLARTTMLILSAFWVAEPLNAQGILNEQIVRSSSTNGRYAISFSTDSDREHLAFHIRDLRSKSNVFRLSGTGDPGETDDDDTRLLYGMIGEKSHGIRQQQPTDLATSYHVHWNSNATLLCVEGGAHKFWHCCLYRKAGTDFTEIPFDKKPVDELIAFAQKPNPKIHNMGVNRFKVRYQHDAPFVHLLEDGYVAINVHPASCNPSVYALPKVQQDRIEAGYELYFLWHLDPTGRMKFIGFCR